MQTSSDSVHPTGVSILTGWFFWEAHELRFSPLPYLPPTIYLLAFTGQSSQRDCYMRPP